MTTLKADGERKGKYKTCNACEAGGEGGVTHHGVHHLLVVGKHKHELARSTPGPP